MPTLELMARVYAESWEGGPESPRFRAYAAAARERAPIAGYNPMTSKDVSSTIEALLAIDAEGVVADAGDDDVALFITVATPGMWTDRLSTEVHHRLGAPTGDDVAVELGWTPFGLPWLAGYDHAIAVWRQ